jgi:hypothetical protein
LNKNIDNSISLDYYRKMIEKNCGHNIFMNLLFNEYKKCSKEIIVKGFLSSFGTGNKYLRSGLPVFAILQSFPIHDFELMKGQTLSKTSPCNICSTFYEETLDEKNEVFYKNYFNTGGYIGPHSIKLYYLYLKYFNEIKNIPDPDENSIIIFNEILNIIKKQKTMKI